MIMEEKVMLSGALYISSEEAPLEKEYANEDPGSLPQRRLQCKWSGGTTELEINEQGTSLRDLKLLIETKLGIPVQRQKLLGLRYKQSPSAAAALKIEDDVAIELLEGSGMDKSLFTVLGRPEVLGNSRTPIEAASTKESVKAAAAAAAAAADLNDEPKELSLVVSDPIMDAEDDDGTGYAPKFSAAKRLATDAAILSQHRRIVDATQLVWIKQPQVGKKLLVLDIDYTLYDCAGAHAATSPKLRRPYLHEFLRSVSRHFDFILWSQTRWQWVEMKITDLGMLESAMLTPLFTLDKTHMLKVPSSYVRSKKSSRYCEIKWLKLIWDLFPDRWGPQNTLHVDDLDKNFLLNRENGILISRYTREDHRTDRELIYLMQYLNHVAQLPDVRQADNIGWRSSPYASL